MVSSRPTTTGAPYGTEAFNLTISSWRAATRDYYAARLKGNNGERYSVAIAFAPEDA